MARKVVRNPTGSISQPNSFLPRYGLFTARYTPFSPMAICWSAPSGAPSSESSPSGAATVWVA